MASAGLVLATFTFGWQVFEYAAEKPKLRAELALTPYLTKENPDDRYPAIYLSFRIINGGSKPATVFNSIITPRLRLPEGASIRQTWGYSHRRDRKPIGRLDDGDAASIEVLARLEEPTLIRDAIYTIDVTVELESTDGPKRWEFALPLQYTVGERVDLPKTP